MGTDAGVKLDDGKARLWTVLLNYFPKAFAAVGSVSEFGAKKYCVRGWESVPDAQSRYRNALVRHLLAGSNEETDQDSGLLHDAHLAWNALAVLELKLRESENEYHYTSFDGLAAWSAAEPAEGDEELPGVACSNHSSTRDLPPDKGDSTSGRRRTRVRGW